MNHIINLELVAFVGTIVVAGAYVPQIWHLIKKHCAWGISTKAWLLWLVAALLIFPHAWSIGDRVFIMLFAAQIIAISFVLVYSYFHQDKKVCEEHQHKFL